MKKISSKLFVALSGIMALGVSVPAVAQQDNGNGTIKIIQPLTLSAVQDTMAFGTIIKGNGTVSISAAATSVRTPGGLGVVGAGQKAAQFKLAGEGGQSVSLKVPATFTMSNGGGGALTVTTSTSYTNASQTDTNTVSLDGSLGGNGEFVFYVGGSIPITTTTASGNYSGSFEVTASYN